MCGIIGINSSKPVSASIINSLKKLEYRGYDSAGLATLTNDSINEKKCSGRVEELEKILLCDLQIEIYPDLEKSLLDLLHNSGYPEIKYEKNVDFESLYKQKFN